MRANACRVAVGLAGVLAAVTIGAGVASANPTFQLLSHQFSQPPTTAQCQASIGIACYNPFQFQKAYGLNGLYADGITGRGRTIVIVDSFGSPTIQSDLATFDKDNNLPAPPSFEVIAPVGASPPYDPGNSTMGGWAIETSLDVEYAHAIAPGASILLVTTPVAETEGVVGFPEMMNAEKYVIDHNLGDVISQSFGATEQTFKNAKNMLDPGMIYSLRYAFQDAYAHHVTVLGSSGDGGASDLETNGTDFYPFRVNSWPSADPLVTSVGGTQLHLTDNGSRFAPDNVWNDQALFGSPASGGGGVSAVFSRPSYQNGVSSVTGDRRGTPDISLSAAVNGGANVYLGFTNSGQGVTPGYYVIGGTSEASPQFAGVVALVDQAAHERLGLLNPSLYKMGDGAGSGITDITDGNNTVTFTNALKKMVTVIGYHAGAGYDLASGLGTVGGGRFVHQLAHGG